MSGAHSNPEGVLAGHDWNTCNGRCSRCMRPHRMPERITSHQLRVFHGCHVRSIPMSSSREELSSKKKNKQNCPSFPREASPVPLTEEAKGTAPPAKSREAILKPLNYEPRRNTAPTEKNTQVADKAPTVVVHVSAASGSTTTSLQDFVSSAVGGWIKYKLASFTCD